KIKNESRAFDDILQGSFLDTYKNLYIKTGTMLNWLGENCRGVDFILKLDADIKVNVHVLSAMLLYIHYWSIKRENNIRLMQELFTNTNELDIKIHKNDSYVQLEKDFLYCSIWDKMLVIRDPKQKNFVSITNFPFKYYPPYCSGWAYILKPYIAKKLYRQSLKYLYSSIPNEDALWTGIIASNANIKIKALNEYYTYKNIKLSTLMNNQELYRDLSLKRFITSYLKLHKEPLTAALFSSNS
ncbi:unnamed protein product, partial [Gordionus sp. m RMFG-2023]